MMVWVHAAVGAALGAWSGRRRAAGVAGIASHLICDLIPHRDYEFVVEAPLAALMLGYIAWRFGPGSNAFAGAVGAILPDAENGASRLGLIPKEATVFPTHNERMPWFLGHGRKTRARWPQVALAVVALILAHAAASETRASPDDRP